MGLSRCIQLLKRVVAMGGGILSMTEYDENISYPLQNKVEIVLTGGLESPRGLLWAGSLR